MSNGNASPLQKKRKVDTAQCSSSNEQTESTRHCNPGVGAEYEVQTLAYFALNLYKNEDVKDFHLRSNIRGFGKFDDIVVDVFYKDGTEQDYGLQLKYADDKDQEISLREFSRGNKGFVLTEYAKKYMEIPQENKKYHFIIYTNRKLKKTKKRSLKRQFKLKNKTNCLGDRLFNTSNEPGHTHKFRILEEAQFQTDEKKSLEELFSQCNIFLNQKNITEMRHSIIEVFKNDFKSCEDTAILFVDFIRNWHEYHYENNVIDKKILHFHLINLLLSKYIIKCPKGASSLDNEKIMYLIESALRKFDVTIMHADVDEDLITNLGNHQYKENIPPYIKDFVKNYFKISSQEFETSSHGLINKCMFQIAENFNIIPKLKPKLSLVEEEKVLNYFFKKFLIIKFDHSSQNVIYQLLKMQQSEDAEITLVLVGQEIDRSKFSHLKIFESLNDIREHEFCLYDNMVKNFRISIPSFEEISFETLIQWNGEIAKDINLKNLLQIANKTFTISRDVEELPDYYIPRAVEALMLPINLENFLECSVKKNNLLVIDCGTSLESTQNFIQKRGFRAMDVDEFRKKRSYNQSVAILSKESCVKKEFDTICRQFSGNVHLIKLIDESKLILIKSKKRDVEAEEMKGDFIEENEICSYFHKGVNILCAEPGIGKSTMMKYLKNKCPSEHWPLFLDLKEFTSFFNKEDCDIIKEVFIEKENEDPLVTKIKKFLSDRKMISLFLDGVDELDNKSIENVLKFVNKLKCEGFAVWISSRNCLKQKIEEALNQFSINICEVNEERRCEYIRDRLQGHYHQSEIDQICGKIYNSVNIANNCIVLGIPLQLFMLTQILIDQKRNNLDLNEEFFVLTRLYSTYFESKIKHTLIKNRSLNELTEDMSSYCLQRYQIPALISCLSNEDLIKLNLNNELKQNDEFMNKLERERDNFGIIKNVNKQKRAVFIHHTHGEYFAAIYFSQNFDKVKILGKCLFQEKYENLRLLLDIHLSENYPLHLNIIYKNIEQIHKHISSNCGDVDKGGRTPLHLVCMYSTKYPLLQYGVPSNFFRNETPFSYRSLYAIDEESSEYKKVVTRLVDLSTIEQKDELFGWSAIQYGLICQCLYPMEIILGKFQKRLNLDVPRNLMISVAYYSSKFGYQHLLSTLVADNVINETRYEDGNLSLLHVAAQSNHQNCDVIQFLLSHIDVNVKDKDGYDVLYHAVNAGNYEVTKFLIAEKANINNSDSNSIITPLHVACQKGYYEIAKVLIENGADVCATYRGCINPLFLACEGAHYELVELLINEYKVDVNPLKGSQLSPLFAACGNGDIKLVNLLIEHKADVNTSFFESDYTPLHFACEMGHLKIAKLLIDFKANVNTTTIFDYWAEHIYMYFRDYRYTPECHNRRGLCSNKHATPLFLACCYGYCKIAKLLIEHNADINTPDNDGLTPLNIACQNGHKDVVDLLIKYDADVYIPDNDGFTPLHLACKKGTFEIVDLLIKHGVKLDVANKNNVTPLYVACQKGHKDVVDLLIKHDANVNIPNNDGFTPLHAACNEGTLEIVDLLIKHGVKLDVANKYGVTPLHIACHEGHDDVVNLLIEAKANVNYPNCHGNTPIQIAALRGHLKIVEMLINYKANINSSNHCGDSALHDACYRGRYKVVELLINSGANIQIRNNDGFTAADLARQKGDIKIVELLKQQELKSKS